MFNGFPSKSTGFEPFFIDFAMISMDFSSPAPLGARPEGIAASPRGPDTAA